MLPDLPAAVLRDVFLATGYTVDAVVELIGEPAHRALGRNNTTPGVLALTRRRDPLAVLTALWPLQQVVQADDLERALPGLVHPLVDAGLLSSDGIRVRARVDIRPYASDDGASGWIVSDLSPGLDGVMAPIRPDFVLGVSPASTTLAQLAIRRPVRRALDLGTGCGVQSLHLVQHAEEVVATDINERALDLARLTAALSGATVDFRHGDLYEPVADEKFDLILSNPPYVMSPPRTDGNRLTYREGGFEGDGLVEHVVRAGAELLADSGTMQVLANWAHLEGQDWAERLAEWVRPSGCDAFIVQREELDPYEYIELWLSDAGLLNSPHYVADYRNWIDYFDRLGISSIGMGWINLHKTGRDQPDISIEHWPHPIEQPIGPALADRQSGVELAAGLNDEALLAAHWVLAADVSEETIGSPGAADPQHIVLRQQRGLRRAVEVDTALAGVLGACDGELPLDRIVGGVASLLDLDAAGLTAEVVPRVRELVVDRLLTLD